MDSSGRFLDREQIDRAQHAGNAFLQTYMKLAHIAYEEGQCLWKLKPKFHYMNHRIDDLSNGWNPRFLHAFMDESFMGYMSRLAKGCHRRTVLLRGLERYIVTLARRWQKRREVGRLSL